MKFILFALFAWAIMGGLAWMSHSKETTTLDEAVNRTHSDRNVSVFKDKENGYICYYRRNADGISCVLDPYR